MPWNKSNNLQPRNPSVSQSQFSPKSTDPTLRCPYVTNVGATQLNPGQSVSDPESALEQPNLRPGYVFSSSGGFSNIFTRPVYQDEAVSYWLNNYAPSLPFTSYDGGNNVGANNGVYNSAGRAFPDVSANGANYMLYLKGVLKPHYGTSLSAPIWGSIITLVCSAFVDLISDNGNRFED
jgi:tripeptidyl-peptidase I